MAIGTDGKRPFSDSDKRYFDMWLQHKHTSDQFAENAAARRNTALITISGGGLYIILEEMRHVQTMKYTLPCLLILLIALAALSFLSALIINRAMYAKSYRAHRLESNYAVLKRKQMEDISPGLDTKIKKVDTQITELNSSIRKFKKTDNILMLCGLGLLIVSSFWIFILHA